MSNLPDGIVIERTPMRDLARRLVEALHDAGIPAWMASRPAIEVASTGVLLRATAWDIRVSEPEAFHARSALATARRLRLVREPASVPVCAGASPGARTRRLFGERALRRN
jgi:hypothetical protein